MKSITHLSLANNSGRRRHRRTHYSQYRWRRLHRKSYVEAYISVAKYGDTFGIAFIIYRVGQPLKRDFVLLKPGQCLSEECAWLVGYQRVGAWLDGHEPNARLYLISVDESRRRRAA